MSFKAELEQRRPKYRSLKTVEFLILVRTAALCLLNTFSAVLMQQLRIKMFGIELQDMR